MSASDVTSSCAIQDEHPSTPAWLPAGGFIPVILGVAAMFWAISFVCEEFGVPSLAKFCKRNRLSDALTGSIFIGTGLSLPVFFIAIAGLFASNSAIGVGAVVGGNLFNHLFTIATSIYVCPEHVMKLDAAVFTREMLIYFLTCLLVLWTVSNGHFADAFNHAFETKQWNSCLSISWPYSLALVASYVAYCFFDGYFYLIEHWVQKYVYGMDSLSPMTLPQNEVQSESDSPATRRNQLLVPPLPLRTVVGNEINNSTEAHQPSGNGNNETINRSNDNSSNSSSSGQNLTLIDAPHRSTPYAVSQSLPDIEIGKMMLTSLASSESASSISSSSKANSITDLDMAMIITHDEILAEEIKAKSMMDSAFDTGDSYLYILTLPADSNLVQNLFFFLTFPIRFFIYCTIPDVRRPGSEDKAILSMCMAVLWLGVLSYVLTLCLTLLGEWWHISSAVMGITVAAWASNFPAHWSSMVVSRHGYGDVSCCNCLGSNTFNNLIGLGLPWLLYSIAYNGQPYEALKDDGVSISVFLMMITIVLHYVVVWASNWVLREWMIVPMLVLYVGEIAFLAYFYTDMV